jgi:putative membrane-bound dehydrogenase-like protein
MIVPLLRSLLVLSLFSLSAPAADTRLTALFLGDKGHHQPAARAEQLIPVMANRGIDVTYTDDVASALRPDTLAKYDALIVYANIDTIAPDQAKALLDYVANGGGFVPLHCASYCFRNSDEVVALIGAQFLRHGTGEFETQVVAADHPIMKGLIPFKTFDETYVHTKHNTKDRVVLQVRPDPAGDEPWTWVRTHGKGRVFYTAYGHDNRTFGQPGFHDLVERGIRWAANKGDVYDSRPRVPSGLKPFAYEPPKAPIPNYVQGNRWGAEGKSYDKMQLPLDPEGSRKHLALPAGFEARLFAAEPEIYKPITMNWDHRGRLWIVETLDYPNEMQRPGEGRDRIVICEDTNDDGKADKFTVFADKLSIPTSLAFARGGVVVTQAPDMLFLKDTDGDDKADVREVLFTGWGIRDTHAGPSNLRNGFDGWIYGIVGYSGFQGTVGGERLGFSQGFFRFKPDGSKLEFLRSTNNNSWGTGFSEDNLLFGSTANGCPSVYMPIANRYYEKLRGGSAAVLANIADSWRMFPATENVRQVDWFGGFTAGAGHALYTARTYPKNYWNSTAFVAEPTGHLVATFSLHPHGTDYTSHNSWNLLASDDEWTSPIFAEVGPDGHVWVIDWYSFIVQHNPTPQGFRTGKGAAYETPLRDKTHGRIYRLVYKDGKESADPKLDPEKPDTLIAGLQSPNMFWRMHAQRLIVERGKTDVVPKLVALVGDPQVDALGLNAPAIHALWALKGLGALGGPKGDENAIEAARKAVKHASAGVRRNALLVLADDRGANVAREALSDKNPQVGLAALLAIADAGPPAGGLNRMGRDLVYFLQGGGADGDRGLADAAAIAGAVCSDLFLSALSGENGRLDGPINETLLSVAARVAEHHARGADAGFMAPIVANLAIAPPRLAEAAAAGLAKGWPKDKPAPANEHLDEALKALFARVSPAAKADVISLATRLGSKGFEKSTAETVASLLATARDEKAPDDTRVTAATQVIELRPGDASTAAELLKLITPRSSPALSGGILKAIGKSEAKEVGAAIVEGLDALTPAARAEALKALIARADWTSALLKGVEGGQITLAQLALDQKQALANHPDRAIAAAAQKLLASAGGGLPDPDRQKVIEELSPIVLKGGDPIKGKVVYTNQCAKCHVHSGEGGKVGPDLTGTAAHPREELLVHILDPSRSVEGNFVAYTVATTDGRVLNGLLASETKTAVDLLDAEGKTITVPRDEIEELTASKKSLMPEGFEKQVGVEDIRDLLAFLTQRGKYLPLDLRKVATVVSTKGMFNSEDAQAERLIFRDWAPKEFAGVPFVLVDPQGDRVPNVVMLNGRNGTIPPKMPRQVELAVNAPAKAIHLLSGISGWGYPSSNEGTTSMIVRLHYADGSTEDHRLLNGTHFADYIRRVDVPGSTFAFPLRAQQVRYLAVTPGKAEPITSLELVKGTDTTAPVVMAVTVELPQ